MKKRIQNLILVALLLLGATAGVSAADGTIQTNDSVQLQPLTTQQVQRDLLLEGKIHLLRQRFSAELISSLSIEELNRLSRLIYAANQLNFVDRGLRGQYEQFKWYNGSNKTAAAARRQFSPIDEANIKAIKAAVSSRMQTVAILEILLALAAIGGGIFGYFKLDWSGRESFTKAFSAFAAVNFLGVVFSGIRIPLGKWIEGGLEWLTEAISGLTRLFSEGLGEVIKLMETALMGIPDYLLIFILTGLAWFLASRRGGWRNRHALNIMLLTLFGMLFIHNMGLWESTVSTITLVLIATFFSVLIGLPLGILTALNQRFYKILFPVLDFMQTMPAFVYLIPAIPFFGLGKVSALFATVIFSMPPAIRLTCLGIRQIPEDLIEASDAFGATKSQKLFKVQIPLAVPTIMAGVNQTIMLSLSMVVIAAMIGAKGLGGEVWKAIQRLKPGMGFEAGIGVVIVAMILDRVTQRIAGTKKEK